MTFGFISVFVPMLELSKMTQLAPIIAFSAMMTCSPMTTLAAMDAFAAILAELAIVALG